MTSQRASTNFHPCSRRRYNGYMSPSCLDRLLWSMRSSGPTLDEATAEAAAEAAAAARQDTRKYIDRIWKLAGKILIRGRTTQSISYMSNLRVGRDY